jgi:WhiB family transcriptional regulator, redox-sensing transcriptional regulator
MERHRCNSPDVHAGAGPALRQLGSASGEGGRVNGVESGSVVLGSVEFGGVTAGSRAVGHVGGSRDVLGELLAVSGEFEEEWQERALCAQTDPEAFFPEKGGSTREAKQICNSCEVRSECLEYALGHDERFGIWGGLSERERRRLKRRVV